MDTQKTPHSDCDVVVAFCNTKGIEKLERMGALVAMSPDEIPIQVQLPTEDRKSVV